MYACCDSEGFTQPTELIAVELFSYGLKAEKSIKRIVCYTAAYEKVAGYKSNDIYHVYLYDISFEEGQLTVGQVFDGVTQDDLDAPLGHDDYARTKKGTTTVKTTEFWIYQTTVERFLRRMDNEYLNNVLDAQRYNLIKTNKFLFGEIRRAPV